jgi:hypothetical protein
MENVEVPYGHPRVTIEAPYRNSTADVQKTYSVSTEPRKGALGGDCIKARKNLSYIGMSGKVGDQLVARKWNDIYIVSSVPHFPEKREWSDAQQAHHLRFRRASSYARKMLQVPEMLEIYETEASGKSMSPYNAAMKDDLTVPEVYEIDISDYTGSPGEEIRVLASDDVIVRAVEVTLVANGEVVEQGDASQDDIDDLLWIYRTTEPNEHESYVVLATATDLPGNRTTGEIEA